LLVDSLVSFSCRLCCWWEGISSNSQ